MPITAIFESWHIGDGNYPPLSKNQIVRLSFEVEPQNVKKASIDSPEKYEHLGSAEYNICGKILKVYEKECENKIIIIESQDIRFYIVDYSDLKYDPGSRDKTRTKWNTFT